MFSIALRSGSKSFSPAHYSTPFYTPSFKGCRVIDVRYLFRSRRPPPRLRALSLAGLFMWHQNPQSTFLPLSSREVEYTDNNSATPHPSENTWMILYYVRFRGLTGISAHPYRCWILYHVLFWWTYIPSHLNHKPQIECYLKKVFRNQDTLCRLPFKETDILP